MTNLEAALSYLKRGWSVVPAHGIDDDHLCTCGNASCASPGKHPRVQWAEYQINRPGDGQVTTWWRRWPDANIAICTGKVSGLVVLDIDPRHGGDESLKDLGRLPDTVTVLTGGGGEHLYYQHPGKAVHNGANLLPGIDIRGDGGYVIAPPSTHISGSAYAWEVSHGPGDMAPAAIPPAVAALLNGPGPAVAERQGDEIVLMDYIEGNVRIADGERNVQMTRLAGHLLATGANHAQALGNLVVANLRCCHPPLDDTELQTILGSIERRHQRREQATQVLNEKTLDANLLANGDRIELARAAWAQHNIADIVDWVRLSSADGVDYQLELADRVVSLGGALLGGFAHLRDVLLNATGEVVPKYKSSEWERYAAQLARLAREVHTGAMRQSDEVQEWLDELVRIATPCEDVGMRRDGLMSGPILITGKAGDDDDGETPHMRLAITPRRMLAWLENSYMTKLTRPELGKRLKRSGWSYIVLRWGTGRGDVIRCYLSPAVED